MPASENNLGDNPSPSPTMRAASLLPSVTPDRSGMKATLSEPADLSRSRDPKPYPDPDQQPVGAKKLDPRVGQAQTLYHAFAENMKNSENALRKLGGLYPMLSGESDESREILKLIFPEDVQTYTFENLVELYSKGKLRLQNGIAPKSGQTKASTIKRNIALRAYKDKYKELVKCIFAKAVAKYIWPRGELWQYAPKITDETTEVILGIHPCSPQEIKETITHNMVDKALLPSLEESIIEQRVYAVAQFLIDKAYRLGSNVKRVKIDDAGHALREMLMNEQTEKSPMVTLVALKCIKGRLPQEERPIFFQPDCEEELTAEEYNTATKHFGTSLGKLLEKETLDIVSGVHDRATSGRGSSVHVHEIKETDEEDGSTICGRVIHIHPAVSPSFKEEFLADQDAAEWSRSCNYGGRPVNRAYRISSQHEEDVFGLGKGKNMRLLPARNYTKGELKLLEMASYLMQAQGKYLEAYAKKNGKKCCNPDNFRMCQAVFGRVHQATYKSHNDQGDLVCQARIPRGGDDASRWNQIYNKLPSPVEMQVLTFVLGTGNCKVDIIWKDEKKRERLRVTTTVNDLHFQSFCVNSTWVHEVHVHPNQNGIRGVWSLRWTLSCANSRDELLFLLEGIKKDEEYHALVKKAHELYDVKGGELMEKISNNTLSEGAQVSRHEDTTVSMGAVAAPGESGETPTHDDTSQPPFYDDGLLPVGSSTTTPPATAETRAASANETAPAETDTAETAPAETDTAETAPAETGGAVGLLGSAATAKVFEPETADPTSSVHEPATAPPAAAASTATQMRRKVSKTTLKTLICEEFEKKYPPATVAFGDKRPAWAVLTDKIFLDVLHRKGYRLKVRTLRSETLSVAKTKELGLPNRFVTHENVYTFGCHPRLYLDRPPIKAGDAVSETDVREHFKLPSHQTKSQVHSVYPSESAALVVCHGPKNDLRFLDGCLPPDLKPTAETGIFSKWPSIHGHGGGSAAAGQHQSNLARTNRDSLSGNLPHPQVYSSENLCLDTLCAQDTVFALFNAIRRPVNERKEPNDQQIYYEGLFTLKNWHRNDRLTTEEIDETFAEAQAKFGNDLVPDTMRPFFNYMEAKFFSGAIVRYNPPKCIAKHVLEKDREGDPVKFYKDIEVVNDQRRGKSTKHRDPPVAIEITPEEWKKHKKTGFLNRNEFIKRFEESQGWLRFVSRFERDEGATQAMSLNVNKMDPDEYFAALLLIAAAVGFRQQGYATLNAGKGYAGPLMPIATGVKSRKREEKILSYLGFGLRAYSTPCPNRNLDVVALHSIMDGSALIESEPTYREAFGIPNDAANSWWKKFNGLPTKLLNKESEDASLLGEIHQELLAQRLLLRMTGNTKFFEDWAADEQFGNGKVANDSHRRLLPTSANIDQFLSYLESHIPEDRRIVEIVSGQHDNSIPDKLKRYDVFAKWARFIFAKDGATKDASKRMLEAAEEEGTWEASQAQLRNLLNKSCHSVGLVTREDTKGLGFIASIVMGDISAILIDVYGRHSTGSNVTCGSGGKACLVVLPGGTNQDKCFETQLNKLDELTDEELQVFGYVRRPYEPGSRNCIRDELTMQPVTEIFIEHKMCKVSYSISRVLPAHLSGVKTPLFPYNHPKIHWKPDDYPVRINAIFRKMVSAFMKLVEDCESLPFLKRKARMRFPRQLLHKRDRFRPGDAEDEERIRKKDEKAAKEKAAKKKAAREPQYDNQGGLDGDDDDDDGEVDNVQAYTYEQDDDLPGEEDIIEDSYSNFAMFSRKSLERDPAIHAVAKTKPYGDDDGNSIFDGGNDDKDEDEDEDEDDVSWSSTNQRRQARAGGSRLNRFSKRQLLRKRRSSERPAAGDKDDESDEGDKKPAARPRKKVKSTRRIEQPRIPGQKFYGVEQVLSDDNAQEESDAAAPLAPWAAAPLAAPSGGGSDGDDCEIY